MDKLTQERFDTITAKDINSLNSTDIEFLKARRSYLSREQKKKFNKVLSSDTPKPVKAETTDRARLKALRTRARRLGIEFRGKTVSELEVDISTVKGASFTAEEDQEAFEKEEENAKS